MCVSNRFESPHLALCDESSHTPASSLAAKVKVKVRLNENGILSVETAQAVEEGEMEVEECSKEETKEGDARMADLPPKAPAGDAPSDQPAANGELLLSLFFLEAQMRFCKKNWPDIKTRDADFDGVLKYCRHFSSASCLEAI